MAMELINSYDLNQYKGTYISRKNLLSETGKHRFICAMCYNTLHCSKRHTIDRNEKWDTDLYTKVCYLVTNMSKCTGIYISSGYRSPGRGGHDICVGGSGAGPHPMGKGIDICFAKKDGKLNCRQIAVIIKSLKYFNGIAPISSSNNNGYIHLDTRSRIWYGDEYYIGYSGGPPNGDFLSYYRRKGLKGFDSLERCKKDVGWLGYENIDLPDQTGIGTGDDSSDRPADIIITVKGSTSRDTLRNERPYFAQYTGSSSVLKYALKELGEASVDWYLKLVAQKNGINSYSSSLTEDSKLMSLLRQGKLIRP